MSTVFLSRGIPSLRAHRRQMRNVNRNDDHEGEFIFSRNPETLRATSYPN
jgi:hypothetical protein